MNSDGKTLLNSEIEIRPFPATASKIVSLCNSQDTNISEIVTAIECDPAIGIKLLAVANSPLYGMKREVASVAQAVVFLGYQRVANLALSIATGPLFSAGDKELYDARVQLFREALGCSSVCRIVGRESGWAEPSEAFFGGMMIDVGKLMLLDFAAEDYAIILANDVTGDTTDIEFEKFGINHAELGGECGRKWALPGSINQAILQHHAEIDSIEFGLSKTVLVGSYLARKWLIGHTDRDPIEPNPTIESVLSELVAEELGAEARDHFASVESCLMS